MRARKIDANQNQIVKQLRQLPGVSVAVTSGLGKGYPDLNVGYKGVSYLIELKDGSKPPSERKLTEEEERFHKEWKGQIAVCNSFDDIFKLIQQ